MSSSGSVEDAIHPAVLCSWQIPNLNGSATLPVSGREGEVTTIVGANGAGKSALGVWLHMNADNANVRRLIAHRKLWFQFAGPDLSPAQRQSTSQSIESWGRQENSRYLDHAADSRASVALFDVLAKINDQNVQLLGMYDAGATRDEVDERVGTRLLDQLNMILESAGLSVVVRITEGQLFQAVNFTRGAEYPIYMMSDGEKSALLLAAEMLVAPAGAVQIIDEPERHLHRSISASLVEAIVHARPDCHFVILTHDLELAGVLGTLSGQTLALTGCTWQGNTLTGWDVTVVDSDSQLPESARLAILGGRKDLLFIEGDTHSLDLSLYRILFPGRTMFPAGGCEQVIRAVTGLRSSANFHWINANGVVDGDGRDDAERLALHEKGVFVLPVSEVESFYYAQPVTQAVAIKQAATLDRNPAELIVEVATAALRAFGKTGTLERLAKGLALAEVRRRATEQLPTEIDAQKDPIVVSFDSPLPRILRDLQAMHASEDLTGLIKAVPIRDTAMDHWVAQTLGFRSARDYEAAARVCIRESAELSVQLREMVVATPVGKPAGNLYDEAGEESGVSDLRLED